MAKERASPTKNFKEDEEDYEFDSLQNQNSSKDIIEDIKIHKEELNYLSDYSEDNQQNLAKRNRKDQINLKKQDVEDGDSDMDEIMEKEISKPPSKATEKPKTVTPPTQDDETPKLMENLQKSSAMMPQQ